MTQETIDAIVTDIIHEALDVMDDITSMDAFDATQPDKCERCHGTGTATWGGTINGRPMHSGVCFRCQGKGVQTDADRRRNYGYDNFAPISL